MAQRPVRVYTLSGCASCSSARSLLRRRGIPFEEVRGDGVAGFRGELVERTGGFTVPQIVVNGEPIGGARDLARLDRRGVLLARVRGETFPRAVVRRRLSIPSVARWILSAFGGGACSPWRHYVELVDRDGKVLEHQPVAGAADAELLAATINEAGIAGSDAEPTAA